MANEVKVLREFLGLSEQGFSLVVGIPKSTLKLYESKSFGAPKDFMGFIRLMERNKWLLPIADEAGETPDLIQRINDAMAKVVMDDKRFKLKAQLN